MYPLKAAKDNPKELLQRLSFAPFVSNTLQFKGSVSFSSGAVSYNEKRNMIICPDAFSLQFYDANSLLPLPLEGRKKGQIYAYVTEMSYWLETETYLLVGSSGRIYYYNLSSKILIEIQKNIMKNTRMITFINSKYYAFSTEESSRLFVGNLKNGALHRFNLGKSPLFYIESLPKKNLLFSTFENGSVVIHRTDYLPKLPLLYSRRDYYFKCGISIQNITMNDKDLIVTAGFDRKIRIWHLSKGKMRLLKVVNVKEEIFRFVYLSRYKLLATTHNTDYITFYSLPFGKLEYRLNVNMMNCQGIFLMEDRNALGVVTKFTEGAQPGCNRDALKPRIKIVQLNHQKAKRSEK